MLPVKQKKSAVVRTTDEIRDWILDEVAASLDTDRASIDSAAPLTSLGVDSLAAFSLTGELASWLGRDLSATLLWDYPTIDAIAEGFGSDTAPAVADALPRNVVALKAGGRKRPIFCTPGIGGHPTSFTPVAEHVDDDQPCYGLLVQGFDEGTEPMTTVQEIADMMIDNMRKVQPEGPYQLVGFSFGGLLAYEMARKLSAKGQRVSLLAFLDTYTPEGRRLRPKWQRFCLHLWALITRPGRVEYLRSRLAGRSGPDPINPEHPHIPDAVPRERVRKVIAANRAAVRAYQPGAYDGGVVVLHAVERPWHSVFLDLKDDFGWSAVASGGVKVIDIPGTHNKMLDDQSNAIVEALRPYLLDD